MKIQNKYLIKPIFQCEDWLLNYLYISYLKKKGDEEMNDTLLYFTMKYGGFSKNVKCTSNKRTD